MRANFAHGAVFAVVILALAGCHSGASSSGWSWNRKNASSTTQIASTPQLPSANATPSSYSPPAYTATTPAATRYPEQAAVPSGYQTTPYAEHPTGYVNSAYAAGSMPNAAAAGGNYSMPNAAPNGAAVPQTGPYNDVYAQGAPSGSGYPASNQPYNYQSYPSTGSTAPQGQQPAQAAQGYSTAVDPYASQASGAAGGYPATDSYRGATPQRNDPYSSPSGDPYAAPGYQTADSRNANNSYPTDRYNTNPAQPEQAAADVYAAQNMAAGDPGTSVPQRNVDGHQMGNTGYVPGQNGYSPPGVTPYQVPAQPNVINTARRDPYYRPGGTSDYVPSGNSRLGPASSGAANAGAANYGSSSYDPYATPATVPSAGYQAPNVAPSGY